MRRGREAAITIQCRLLCYGKTCSWTHVVWKCLLFVQFNVTYVHILSVRGGQLSSRPPQRPRRALKIVSADNATACSTPRLYCTFWFLTFLSQAVIVFLINQYYSLLYNFNLPIFSNRIRRVFSKIYYFVQKIQFRFNFMEIFIYHLVVFDILNIFWISVTTKIVS